MWPMLDDLKLRLTACAPGWKTAWRILDLAARKEEIGALETVTSAPDSVGCGPGQARDAEALRLEKRIRFLVGFAR